MKKELLRKIKENEMKPFELPMNVRDLLAAQDVSDFREDRFLLRKAEAAIVEKMSSSVSFNDGGTRNRENFVGKVHSI